jgi:hypothetical protein
MRLKQKYGEWTRWRLLAAAVVAAGMGSNGTGARFALFVERLGFVGVCTRQHPLQQAAPISTVTTSCEFVLCSPTCVCCSPCTLMVCR